MTKRERVEATLNLQETDRVPLYDLLRNDDTIRFFTGRLPTVGREGRNLACRAVGRMLDMTRSAGYTPRSPGSWVDEDGFTKVMLDKWISGGIHTRPFSDVEGARQFVDKQNKRLKNPIDLKAYAENFRAGFVEVQNEIGDDTVQLLDQTGTGLDVIRGHLGLELFAYLEEDEPGLISEFLEAFTSRVIRQIHAVADRRLSPCALTFGDIAFKGTTLHSPDWLRREFFPLLGRINAAWHEHGIKCLFHSDGYLMDVMDDLIDAGIDGINPIEVVAGMDLAEVKRKYGSKLFIAGGIDISQLMSLAGPEDVRETCLRAIETTGTGYFLGSTTELDNGSKAENILAMVEAAWGRKPEKSLDK